MIQGIPEKGICFGKQSVFFTDAIVQKKQNFARVCMNAHQEQSVIFVGAKFGHVQTQFFGENYACQL